MALNPIPEGFHTVTPYLTVQGADRLLKFLADAFEAKEIERLNRGDGTVGHATVLIGNSMMMVAEASAEWKPTSTTLYLYVPDVDATYQRAVAAGGVSIMAPANQFYGDRNGGVKDAFGNNWWIGSRVEEVSPEELQKRSATMMKKSSS